MNSFRVGANRSDADNNVTRSAINPLAADSTLASDPGRYAPAVVIPGLTKLLGGLGGSPTYYFRFTSIQAYDDAFVVRGNHSLKFGFGLERMRLNLEALSNPNGTFNFNSLAAFLTNVPKSFSSGFANTLTWRNLRQTMAGTYIQDDWRLRPNLVVNLGLRYEAATVPTEIHGKLSTLRNPTDAQPHLGDPYFSNPTVWNFEPRIGFAYDPFGKGRTSIRSGFGIYDVLPLPYQFILLSSLSAPFYEIGSIAKLPAGSFPYQAFPLLTVSTLNQTYVDPHPRRNYVMQWNFNVQQDLTRNMVLTLGYIGTRGVHQPFRTDDINMVLPKATPQGYLWPSPVGSGTLLNPNAGEIRAIMYESISSYHALQSQLLRRMQHGLQLQLSYTWSKSLDNGSGTLAGDSFDNSIASNFFFDTRLTKGLSDFNVSHNLVINSLWQVPNKGRSGFSGAILNDWQLGGIYKFNTGVPFTMILGGDPLGLNDANPYSYPNVLSMPGCASLVNPGNPNQYVKAQCFSFPNPQTLLGNEGRNVLTGPSTFDLDFSLIKNNRVPRISENFNTQFRVEVFNILNHANFAPPTSSNITIFGPTGAAIPGAGAITSTVTTSRQIQLALKLAW
ncbi:MAG: TonB-dependent receptor [Acidobacteriia bacterium]|nr:TonB-dependent receptor [Terriglobia bacterium]